MCGVLIFSNGVKLLKATSTSQQTKPSLCGDPRLAIANPMCCSNTGQGHFYCNYMGERMPFAAAQEMCSSHGEEICQTGIVTENSECGTGATSTSNSLRSWSSVGCQVHAKVDFSSGEVAIVHDIAPDVNGEALVEAMVDEDTLNFSRLSGMNQRTPL